MPKNQLMIRIILSNLFLICINTAIARTADERADVSIEKKVRKERKRTLTNRQQQLNKTPLGGLTLEKKLIEGITKTLKFLNKTASQMPKKSRPRLAMLERILNLLVEQASYISTEEQEYFNQTWLVWRANGAKGREPKRSTVKSRKHWLDAYNFSKKIRREYPRGENNDQIAFNAALSLQYLDKDEQAAKEFLEIIRKYPHSKSAGDSNFALGDYYFDLGHFNKAQKFYQATLKYKRSSRYGWAIFKLGWCYFNLSLYQKSLDTWKTAVTYSQNIQPEKGKQLKLEVMRDMVFSFAELDKVDDAVTFFKKHQGSKGILKLLNTIAQIYTEQGKFSKSISTWRRLILYFPNSKEALKAQSEIVSLAFDSKNYKKFWNELKILSENYGTNSPWFERQDEDTKLEAEEILEDLLLYYPKLVHQESQKKNNASRTNEARLGYEKYLSLYPDTKYFYEIKEYLGDIAYSLKKYHLAGQHYFDIALKGKEETIIYDKNGKKTNIHKRSAKNMLDAFNKDYLPELTALIKIKPNFKNPPRLLSKKAKYFIRACDYYIKWYPKDDKTVKNCEVFTSEIYYRNQDLEKAQKNLWKVANKYSTTKEGVTAAEALIPLYEGKNVELRKIAQKLLSIPSYQRGPLAKKLNSLINDIVLTEISNVKSDLLRAKGYEAQAKKNPRDKNNDKLWNNAAVDYLKAGNYSNALNAFLTLTKNHKSSPLYPSALLQIGTLYDGKYDLSGAKYYFLNFARRFPKRKESPAALERACKLAIALASSDAQSICIEFARKYPSAGPFPLERLISYLFEKNKIKEMTKVIEHEYLAKLKLTSNQKILAYYKIIKANNSRGSKFQSARAKIFREFKKGKTTGEALRITSGLYYNQAHFNISNFHKLKLKGGTVAKLQESIVSISNALTQLEKALSPVFSTKDSFWGTAALYQLGHANEKFSLQLKSPPSVNGVEHKLLVEQLSGSVSQTHEKAKEYYTQGLQVAREFNIQNEWTVEIFNGLNRVVKRSASFQELIDTPLFFGSVIPDSLHSNLE